VARALEELPGVVAVRVDEAAKTAHVTYDPRAASLDAMTRAIARVDVRLRIRHWLHRLLRPRTPKARSGP
jgi:copper chaperone CopZ